MANAARKQNISEDADLYTAGSNESLTEVRVPEILPPRAPMFKVIDGKGTTAIRGVNESRPASLRWGRVANGSTEVEFAEIVPILDEIKGVLPGTPIFVLQNGLDVRRRVSGESDFQSYLDDYGAIQELRKRQSLPRRGLLWASLTCFGIAAVFLIALIGQLS
jgi:hypothetical protein